MCLNSFSDDSEPYSRLELYFVLLGGETVVPWTKRQPGNSEFLMVLKGQFPGVRCVSRSQY